MHKTRACQNLPFKAPVSPPAGQLTAGHAGAILLAIEYGNRSWKLGANPTQGRCCNSPVLLAHATGFKFSGKAPTVRACAAYAGDKPEYLPGSKPHTVCGPFSSADPGAMNFNGCFFVVYFPCCVCKLLQAFFICPSQTYQMLLRVKMEVYP